MTLAVAARGSGNGRSVGPVQPMAPGDFEDVVRAAMDSLPPDLAGRFSNVAVVVDDENDENPDLLGLYEGVPLTERDTYSGVLPDRICLYRIPLCLMAEDYDDLVDEVRVTVIHEFGHHMGIDDDTLHHLGWA